MANDPPPTRPDPSVPAGRPVPPQPSPPPQGSRLLSGFLSGFSPLQRGVLIGAGVLLGLIVLTIVSLTQHPSSPSSSSPPALYCAALAHLQDTIGQAKAGRLTPDEMTTQLADIESDLEGSALIMQSDGTPGGSAVTSLATAVGHLKVASATAVGFAPTLDEIGAALGPVPHC